jgi:hypothetical protein
MTSRNGRLRAKYRVGERVQFQLGQDPVWGTITRVPWTLSHGRPRWYHLSLSQDPDEPYDWMMEEAGLEPDSISRAPLEKSEILEYFTNSGLVAMLISSPWSETAALPAWLCRSMGGMVTYTFNPGHGLIGGKPIPQFTLYREGEKIDARKKDEVAEFLLSFGLTPEEAADVIRAVGVAPVRKPRRRKAETA